MTENIFDIEKRDLLCIVYIKKAYQVSRVIEFASQSHGNRKDNQYCAESRLPRFLLHDIIGWK